jgi:hypothetical protein
MWHKGVEDKPNNVFKHNRVQPNEHMQVTTFFIGQLPAAWFGCRAGVRPLPGLHELQIWPTLNYYLRGFVKDKLYILSMDITLKT